MGLHRHNGIQGRYSALVDFGTATGVSLLFSPLQFRSMVVRGPIIDNCYSGEIYQWYSIRWWEAYREFLELGFSVLFVARTPRHDGTTKNGHSSRSRPLVRLFALKMKLARVDSGGHQGDPRDDLLIESVLLQGFLFGAEPSKVGIE